MDHIERHRAVMTGVGVGGLLLLGGIFAILAWHPQAAPVCPVPVTNVFVNACCDKAAPAARVVPRPFRKPTAKPEAKIAPSVQPAPEAAAPPCIIVPPAAPPTFPAPPQGPQSYLLPPNVPPASGSPVFTAPELEPLSGVIVGAAIILALNNWRPRS